MLARLRFSDRDRGSDLFQQVIYFQALTACVFERQKTQKRTYTKHTIEERRAKLSRTCFSELQALQSMFLAKTKVGRPGLVGQEGDGNPSRHGVGSTALKFRANRAYATPGNFFPRRPTFGRAQISLASEKTPTETDMPPWRARPKREPQLCQTRRNRICLPQKEVTAKRQRPQS